MARTCDWLVSDDASPLVRLGGEMFDVRGVLRTPHREADFGALPDLLRPAVGRLGLTDYEKAFCPDPAADIFEMRGIDRARGAMVVVRPDQYVGAVLPLDGTAGLAAYLAAATGR